MQSIVVCLQQSPLSTHNMRKVLVVTLLLTLVLGCKKTIEQPAEEKKVTEDIEMKRITAFPWVIYKVTLGGTNIWDLGLIESCTKDDSYKFYKDSTMTQYENAEVCSGGQDSTKNTWYFYDNKAKLIGTLLGITDTATVLSLQETEMSLLVNYNGNPVNVYFKKK